MNHGDRYCVAIVLVLLYMHIGATEITKNTHREMERRPASAASLGNGPDWKRDRLCLEGEDRTIHASKQIQTLKGVAESEGTRVPCR